MSRNCGAYLLVYFADQFYVFESQQTTG